MDRDQVSSPTVTAKARMLTAVIVELECIDDAMCNIPNSSVQT